MDGQGGRRAGATGRLPSAAELRAVMAIPAFAAELPELPGHTSFGCPSVCSRVTRTYEFWLSKPQASCARQVGRFAGRFRGMTENGVRQCRLVVTVITRVFCLRVLFACVPLASSLASFFALFLQLCRDFAAPILQQALRKTDAINVAMRPFVIEEQYVSKTRVLRKLFDRHRQRS